MTNRPWTYLSIGSSYTRAPSVKKEAWAELAAWAALAAWAELAAWAAAKKMKINYRVLMTNPKHLFQLNVVK